MKKILVNLDKKLLLFSSLLFILGLLMVFSSSSVSAFARYELSPTNFFFRQAFFLLTGIILFFILIRIPTKKYKYWGWGGIVIVTTLLIALLVWGVAVNNTIGWIGYNGFGIQPSEFAKIIMIVWMSVFYEKYFSQRDSISAMIIPFIVTLLITFLIIMQNDYGTAFIFAFIGFFMFCLSPTAKQIKKKFYLFLGIVLISSILVLCGLLIGKSEILKDKLSRFNIINPCGRYQTTGNQICNGYIAINGSNIIGKGLGNSTQKYLYLPESHTDFIYAIYIEELGLIGCIGLILGYVVVLGRIISIAKRTCTDKNAMICYGVATLIFVHIIINLFGLLGLMPLTGVPLPFMSYGGSFTWVIIIGLTLVQRINVETNLELKKGINYKK